MRILLTIEYDGTAYAGFQRQANALAVQQVLEEALSRACGERIVITGASRTDSGVHARGQRAHFDTSSHIPPEKFPFVLNTMLPRDIRVVHAFQVADGFHARFMTEKKTYTYRINNSRHGSAIDRLNHAHVPLPLNEAAMNRAIQSVIGKHDFAAFQASGGTAKSTVREMHSASVVRVGDEIVFIICGSGFLYNMVRIMAGTLIEIGKGALGEDAFTRAIETSDRLALGPTAPAQGLELTRIDYPEISYQTPDAVRWHEE